jgi:hypothetical protein
MPALPLRMRGRAGSANLLDGSSSISGFVACIGALALMGRGAAKMTNRMDLPANRITHEPA